MKTFLPIPILALFLLAASSQCFALEEKTEEQSRAAALGFLADLPELKGVSLQMPEKAFLKLMDQRKLRYERERSDRKGEVSYYVRIPGKERDANVYFGFRDGMCSGIQRLQPGPRK